MLKKLFGTDGIRGKAGEFPISPEVCFSSGMSFGKFVEKKKIIIGSDTRESSDWIVHLIKQGLIEAGILVIDAGVIPTPVLAHCVRSFSLGGGIVVTASHNPYCDNGIKFFNATGKKFNTIQEEELERMILDNTKYYQNRDITVEERHFINNDCVIDYFNSLKSNIDLKIIENYIPLDCANGAASYFTKSIESNYGIKIPVFNISPSGQNINFKCGAASFSNIKNDSAALDGDADRLILRDSHGNLITGDIILMFIADNIETLGIVGTVMTNQAVENYCKERGIEFHRTDVGDRFIREKMDNLGIVLGGETSGHIIIDNLNFTGDGFAVYLKIMELLNSLKISLSDLSNKYLMYPQRLINITVKNKIPFLELPGFNKMLKKVENMLKNDGGRIFPRYSGTENCLRILLETKTETLLNRAEKFVLDFTRELEEK